MAYKLFRLRQFRRGFPSSIAPLFISLGFLSLYRSRALAGCCQLHMLHVVCFVNNVVEKKKNAFF